MTVGTKESKVREPVVVVHAVDVVQLERQGLALPLRRQAALVAFVSQKPGFEKPNFEVASTEIGRVLNQNLIQLVLIR